MLHKKSRRTSLLKLFALIPIVGITLALNARTVTDYVYDGPQKQEPVKKGKKTGTIKMGNQEIKVTEVSKADTSKQAEQQQVNGVSDDKVYAIPETMPEFPGGTQALLEHIKNNLKWPNLEDVDVQGRVIVSFVVEKDGSISDAKVIKSIHPAYDAEALRVIKSMPRWNPGTMNGKPVSAKYAVPVIFRLSNDTPAKDNAQNPNTVTGTFVPNDGNSVNIKVTYDDEKKNKAEEVGAATKGIRFLGTVDPKDVIVYVDDKVIETEKINDINPDGIDRIQILNGEKEGSKKSIHIYMKKNK
jgi:TonB family protein